MTDEEFLKIREIILKEEADWLANTWFTDTAHEWQRFYEQRLLFLPFSSEKNLIDSFYAEAKRISVVYPNPPNFYVEVEVSDKKIDFIVHRKQTMSDYEKQVRRKEKIKETVLELINVEPRLAHQIRLELVKLGYTNDEGRTAIAELWDSGKLNVGLDQLLRPIKG